MASDEMKPFRLALTDAINLLAARYSMAAKTESPIETILGAELQRILEETLSESFAVGETGKEADFTLVPQFNLSRYRYDFAVFVAGDPAVLIECDGKDFHSSLEQIDNDAAKDALALARGYQIKRFPGWRINAHPKECAKEVIQAIVIYGRRLGYC
jgi:very-short-patch-repair endonuclease